MFTSLFLSAWVLMFTITPWGFPHSHKPVTHATSSIPVGISYGDTLVWESPTTVSQTLDDAVALGVTSIRLDLNWDDVQHDSATSYNWSSFDGVVQAARSRNLTVLPIIAYTPPWARASGCTDVKCAPADPNAFASFAATASARYKSMNVHTWEIWNEPNVVEFWKPTPNVAQYVQLLKVTSTAIKAVDPHAVIVSGGIAPIATFGGNLSQYDFFNAFVTQGGANFADAIGDHPYSFPVLPSYLAGWNAWQVMIGDIEGILKAHGIANKKIWVTEYGAPTNGPGMGATPTDYKIGSNPDHVDEALQAQMANDSIHLARTSNFVAAIYWYSYKDLGTSTSTVENFFGLRRADGSAKPAWQTLHNAILSTN
jgi:hypothetical protein